MKRVPLSILSLLCSTLVLAACGEYTPPVQQTSGPAAVEATHEADIAVVESAGISRIRIKDIYTGIDKDQTEKLAIQEFCGYLKNQKLTGIKKLEGEAYKAEFFDLSGKPIMTATFYNNSVYFDRDIKLGNTVYENGAYESDYWSWPSLSYYTEQLYNDTVFEPEFVQYPATLRIPGFSEYYYKIELFSKGNGRVNTYETYPKLYDFFNTCFKSKDMEISAGEKHYDYEFVQAETEKLKKETQCIHVSFGSSDTLLEIKSQNKYKQTVMANNLTLAKDPQKPGIFKLLTDRMIFDIKAGSETAKKFDALFSEDNRTTKYVTPDEIKRLFDGKKPYYMEYVCKNLGMEEWNGREASELKVEKMQLNQESKPYTVVNLRSSFTQRMLVYKQNTGKAYRFVGYMEFRGWPEEPKFRQITAGGKMWFAGKNYMGHGTGEYSSNEQWYMVTDKGVESVLQYPLDVYSEGPYGGYSIKAKKVYLKSEGGIKVTANFETSRKYNLYTSNADENGAVRLNGIKTVDFIWDEKNGKFISDNKTDSNGAYLIPADTPEIAEARDILLEKHYTELIKIIEGIPALENEYERHDRAESIKSFLNDCSEGQKKADLLGKLAEVSPE